MDERRRPCAAAAPLWSFNINFTCFWYDGCNCGSTRSIKHLYTCGIRQGWAFVSMQHLGQSKVTSRSLQGQSFINSNKNNYTSQAIVHFWITQCIEA